MASTHGVTMCPIHGAHVYGMPCPQCHAMPVRGWPMNWWQEYNDQQCERQDENPPVDMDREAAVDMVLRLEADGYVARAVSSGPSWKVEVARRSAVSPPPTGGRRDD